MSTGKWKEKLGPLLCLHGIGTEQWAIVLQRHDRLLSPLLALLLFKMCLNPTLVLTFPRFSTGLIYWLSLEKTLVPTTQFIRDLVKTGSAHFLWHCVGDLSTIINRDSRQFLFCKVLLGPFTGLLWKKKTKNGTSEWHRKGLYVRHLLDLIHMQGTILFRLKPGLYRR